MGFGDCRVSPHGGASRIFPEMQSETFPFGDFGESFLATLILRAYIPARVPRRQAARSNETRRVARRISRKIAPKLMRLASLSSEMSVSTAPATLC